MNIPLFSTDQYQYDKRLSNWMKICSLSQEVPGKVISSMYNHCTCNQYFDFQKPTDLKTKYKKIGMNSSKQTSLLLMNSVWIKTCPVWNFFQLLLAMTVWNGTYRYWILEAEIHNQNKLRNLTAQQYWFWMNLNDIFVIVYFI